MVVFRQAQRSEGGGWVVVFQRRRRREEGGWVVFFWLRPEGRQVGGVVIDFVRGCPQGTTSRKKPTACSVTSVEFQDLPLD